MKQEDKQCLRNILFFAIGFVGFQILWYFVIYPAIID